VLTGISSLVEQVAHVPWDRRRPTCRTLVGSALLLEMLVEERSAMRRLRDLWPR